MTSIENLLNNSGLPGPRGNLELLYTFSKTATAKEVEECFTYYRDDLHNSPEEFVVMCGITGYCMLHKNNIEETLAEIRKYSSHCSWRVREAVAMGIQEIAENKMDEIIKSLKKWVKGNELEQRAVVAALCEPKLLKNKTTTIEVLQILDEITRGFNAIDGKINESQTTLRKALGYGWSVAIAAIPPEGKAAFESIASNTNKHVRWIVKENLTKNRLLKMDKVWVEKLKVDI